MPELPEVETIRRDMARLLLGATIQAVEVRDPTAVREPTIAEFSAALPGSRITAVARRGKYLIVRIGTSPVQRSRPARLPTRQFLIIHLRMTGQLLLGFPDPVSRVRFTFADGRTLNFRDQRRFGEIRLVKDWRRVEGLRRLGIDPLPMKGPLQRGSPNGGHRSRFLQVVRRHTGMIKALLMNQQVIAGVGNIYAQEALFLAGIRPTRRAHRLRLPEVFRLWEALQATLRDAIHHRGSSQNTYRDVLGRSGRAQHFHAVYRRAGQPCPRCQAPLVQVKVSGRSSVFCRSCQR